MAPFWFADVMVDVIGTKETSRMLQLGSLHPSGRALDIGSLALFISLFVGKARCLSVAGSLTLGAF